MKIWVNNELKRNNAIKLTGDSVSLHSLDAKALSTDAANPVTESQLMSHGTQETEIALTVVTQIRSLSTDNDVDVTHGKGKDEDVTSLTFADEADKASFLSFLPQVSNGAITPVSQSLSPLSAASMSIASLVVALIAIAVYINKIPYVAIGVGGVWAMLALCVAYKRYNNPPVKTVWDASRTTIESGVRIFGLARAWGLVLALVFGGATVLPDQNGAHIIHDHVASEMLSENRIDALVQKGGDLNYIGSDGQSALHLLVDQAHWRAIEIGESLMIGMLQKATTGKEMNISAKDLRNEPEELAIALIERGADVNIENENGVSVLHYALVEYADSAVSLRLFESLLEHGASADFDVFGGQSVQSYIRDNPVQAIDGGKLDEIFAAYE